MRAVAICLLSAGLPFAISCAGDDVSSPGSDRTPITAAANITPLPCGASIDADLVLLHDMVCTGDALIVNADGITVDLNGHTITGAGAGIGITVRQRAHVTIVSGTIQGFVSGIFASQSSYITITETRLTQNREAIFFAGTTYSDVVQNVIWQNQLRGIMLRPTGSGLQSTNNLLKENILIDNRSGVLVFGQPGNTIKENRISGSTLAALDLTGGGASGNRFMENVLELNAAGVLFGNGWVDNSFVENQYLRNTCGTSGPAGGNTFSENIFVGNDTDAC